MTRKLGCEEGGATEYCLKCGRNRVYSIKSQHYCYWCFDDELYRARQMIQKEIYAKRKADVHWRAWILWDTARKRAYKNGVLFTLDLDTVEQWLRVGCCAVTGLALELDCGASNAYAPSLDRKDNDLGYTNENTQLVCWIYNRAKGNGSHEDVLALVEAINAAGRR